jgi:tetratricopeptide (TPR) repeat protein/cold shock CspA family protein
MGDVEAILAEVRSLAARGGHQLILARYGGLDDEAGGDLWQSADLLYEIGRAYGMLGHEDKVERYLLRCADLAPHRAAVFHCAIGWFFQRKKKWTKALRWYDRALESFPTYHLCLFRRGYCLEKLHRPREAVEALQRARNGWQQAGSEQRDRGRGVQVQVLFHLSRSLRDLGELDASEETLEACRALDTECEPPTIRREHILASQGELLIRRGNLDAALATFERAREIDPESSYLWERLGRVCELRGDVERAREAYRHASSLPRGAFAFLSLGRLHTERTHDHQAAATALAEALRQVHSAEPLVRLELARLQLALGRPRAALAETEQALACRREGTFVEALRLAAELADRLGDPAKALTYLNKLSHMGPDDTLLSERIASQERLALHQGEPPADPPLPPGFEVLAKADVQAPGRIRLQGVVDRFFVEKGYGFVRYGEGQKMFFHITQCQDGLTGIAPGATVSFVPGHNPKKGKPQAEGVRLHC